MIIIEWLVTSVSEPTAMRLLTTFSKARVSLPREGIQRRLPRRYVVDVFGWTRERRRRAFNGDGSTVSRRSYRRLRTPSALSCHRTHNQVTLMFGLMRSGTPSIYRIFTWTNNLTDILHRILSYNYFHL